MKDRFEIENGVLISYRGRNTSVIVPDGVTEIGRYVFESRHKIREIILPDSIVKIGVMAFANCTQLKKFIVPPNVKQISAHAFYGCEKLKEIFLPEGLLIIEDYAFDYCPNLTCIRIPDSVIMFGSGNAACIFSSSLFLESYPDGFIIHHDMLVQYTGTDKIVTIPETVKKIRNGAFYDCPLETLIVPETLENLPEYLFVECEKLQYIEKYHIRVRIGRKNWGKALYTAECVHKFLQNPQDKKQRTWLIRNRKNLLCLDDDVFRNVLETGQIFNAATIDEYIRCAVTRNEHEKQILLMNYKYQHFGFEDIGEKLKL